jgi:hypothetical protein
MKFYLKKSDSESNLIMGKHYDSQFSDGRFVYSTGERITPSQWSNAKGTNFGMPRKGNEALTELLLNISKKTAEYIRLNRSSLTKEGLKTFLDGLRPKEERKVEPKGKNTESTMADIWEQYLAAIKDTVALRTYYSYANSFKVLKEKRAGHNFSSFLTSKGWNQIKPSQFTMTHYTLYLGYLKKNCKPNTVAKRLKHFKSFLGHIDDLKLTLGMDPARIKYKEGTGLKISLTEEQLQKYIDAVLTDSAARVRDLAVIQCSTGLRISDRGRIDRNLSDGKISLRTKKTDTPVEILITPTVRSILERYNYELPKISEQKFREGLKAIHKKLFPGETMQVREGSEFKDVFVWEEISSHDMVRTFITLSAERGMSIPSIAKITGKSVTTLIKNYLVESQRVADKEMEKAWGYSPLKVVK